MLDETTTDKTEDAPADPDAPTTPSYAVPDPEAAPAVVGGAPDEPSGEGSGATAGSPAAAGLGDEPPADAPTDAPGPGADAQAAAEGAAPAAEADAADDAPTPAAPDDAPADDAPGGDASAASGDDAPVGGDAAAAEQADEGSPNAGEGQAGEHDEGGSGGEPQPEPDTGDVAPDEDVAPTASPDDVGAAPAQEDDDPSGAAKQADPDTAPSADSPYPVGEGSLGTGRDAGEAPAVRGPEHPGGDEERPRARGPKIISEAPPEGATPPAPKRAPRQPRAAKRAPREKREREPLPWPELRAAAATTAKAADVEALKELFRLLPADVRDETVEGVREYRKGARRPVSAFAGKSLARAVHTARRARRKPESDAAVSEAMGQAMAAEIVASLDVEVAAEVILPKRDLLEREAKNARRRQRAEDDKARDDRRRRAREEGGKSGGSFGGGGFSGPKIRGLEALQGLFDDAPKDDDQQ